MPASLFSGYFRIFRIAFQHQYSKPCKRYELINDVKYGEIVFLMAQKDSNSKK